MGSVTHHDNIIQRIVVSLHYYVQYILAADCDILWLHSNIGNGDYIMWRYIVQDIVAVHVSHRTDSILSVDFHGRTDDRLIVLVNNPPPDAVLFRSLLGLRYHDGISSVRISILFPEQGHLLAHSLIRDVCIGKKTVKDCIYVFIDHTQ